ncbi:MAG: acyl-CoA hydrolase [Natronomonas sp.]|jgi:acyl-CoA hydrolase|uniref:acyl-CoA thioesterase n=1 Tax=Natronomonas sp. TaxID=2184060 RepID=UPI003988B225
MVELRETRIQTRQRVQPDDTNNYGSAHGGMVMLWMDEAAAMSAIRFTGEWCVTAHVDGIDFRAPVPSGDTLYLDAYVYDAGRTSCKVRLRAYHEDPKTGSRTETTDSTFVFVAVDDNREPMPVTTLECSSEESEQLRAEAFAAFEE